MVVWVKRTAAKGLASRVSGTDGTTRPGNRRDGQLIMRRLDRLHLEFPFAGSRMLRGLLAAEGCKIGVGT